MTRPSRYRSWSAFAGGLLLITVSAHVASAEPVRGVVLDDVTGEPVPGAYVGSAPSGAATALSDEEGRFTIDAPEGDTSLVIVATGYGQVTLALAAQGAPAVLEARLRIDKAQIEEVIIIDDEVPEVAETPTYELEIEELRALPGAGNDTIKSLQSLPGVARVPFGAGGLSLRGASPRDTSVHLDGIEVPILYHFGGLASFYPSALLGSVELAPGGFGAGYGRAQGGLVELTSKAGRADKWRAAGEASLIDASARADGPAAGGTWSFGVRRSYVDAVLALALPDDGDFQLTVPPRYLDAQARYDVRLSPRDKLAVVAFGSDDQLQLKTDATAGSPNGFSFGSSFARIAAIWERNFDGGMLKVTPWTGFDRSKIRVRDQGLTRTTYPLGLRAEATRYFDWGFVNVGLDSQGSINDLYLKNEPPPMPGVSDPTIVEKSTSSFDADTGFFAETLVRSFDGKLNLKPGLRVERYGISDEWVVDPRLTVSHELHPRVTARETLGIYHQPAIAADADWGNPNLRSSYAVQSSVGVEVRPTDWMDTSVTGFSRQSERLAVDVVSSASPVSAGGSSQSGGAGAASAELLYEQFGAWTYRDNVGKGNAYGVEWLAKASFDRAFGWLSYTYSRSLRRNDPAEMMGYVPYVLDQPHVLTALASTEVGRGWRLGARIRYATGNPFTPVAGSYFDSDRQRYVPIDGDIMSARLPAFFQVDLRVDRQWKRSWGTMGLFLDIQNATNRANAEGVTYDFDYATQSYSRGLPIFPSIGVEYRP